MDGMLGLTSVNHDPAGLLARAEAPQQGYNDLHMERMTCVETRKAGDTVQTSVTKRGQTVIPAAIRKRHNIGAGARLVWLDDGDTIRVVPVPGDPLRALRGSGRGRGLTELLLSERSADRARENSPDSGNPE
jgi:AbrB family looped-hinge helix DNA binding protein